MPAHSLAYSLTLLPHAAAATAAIGVGLAALLARKGSPLHRRSGRWYWRLIAVVAGSGALLLLLGAWSTRLLVLLALVIDGTWSGVRVLRRRRPDIVPADRATRADVIVAGASLVVAMGAIAAAATGITGRDTAAVWSTAPLLAAYAGYDLARFARPAAWPMRPRLWLGEHIVKLTGAWFGALSAFSGNVFTFIPMPWRIVLPNVLGIVVTGYFLSRMRRRLAAPLASVAHA
jgi:uncharacterized membrane protein